MWWAVLRSWKPNGKGRSHCPLEKPEVKSMQGLFWSPGVKQGCNHPIVFLQGPILSNCLSSRFTSSRHRFAFLPTDCLWLAPAQKWGDPPGNSCPQKSSGFRRCFHKEANVQIPLQKHRYNLAAQLTGNIPHVGVSALAVSRGARNTRGGGSAFLIAFGIFRTSLWM